MIKRHNVQPSYFFKTSFTDRTFMTNIGMVSGNVNGYPTTIIRTNFRQVFVGTNTRMASFDRLAEALAELAGKRD